MENKKFKDFYKFLKGSTDDVEKELNELNEKYYLMVFNPVIYDGIVSILVQATNERK